MSSAEVRGGRGALEATLEGIVPIALGGDDTEFNLQTLCRSCNSSKGARSSADYRWNMIPHLYLGYY